MLELMPEQRATASKALEHPFLAESGVTNKAAKAVQKVRFSFVGEVLHTMQDLSKEIAQFVSTDPFLQKSH
jgi:predicted HAD superfamily phosphohydrolase